MPVRGLVSGRSPLYLTREQAYSGKRSTVHWGNGGSVSQVTGHRSRVTDHRSRVTGHRSRVTGRGSQIYEYVNTRHVEFIVTTGYI
jgi:TnpA family transposase